MLTSGGARNLTIGLKEFGILDDGSLLDIGVKKLREMANSSQVASNV